MSARNFADLHLSMAGMIVWLSSTVMLFPRLWQELGIGLVLAAGEFSVPVDLGSRSEQCGQDIARDQRLGTAGKAIIR